RDRRELARLSGLGVTHGGDGFDAMVAAFGDGAADGDRFGADRDPADIGVDVHAGDDTAIAGPHGRADLLPLVAIALADGFGGDGDQLFVIVAQHNGECVPSSVGGQPMAVYFASSFRPSRISCAVSAFS